MLFANDDQIYILYRKNATIKRLINKILTENIDYTDYIFNETHVCCRACTLKILTFYSYSKDDRQKMNLYEVIYTILIHTFEEIHNKGLKKENVSYNNEIFFILYEDHFKTFLEYTNSLSLMECLSLFDQNITIKSITFLKKNMKRINENNEFLFNLIIKMTNERNSHEHILFSRFISAYLDTLDDFSNNNCISPLMNYCVSNIQIKELAEVYEKMAKK